MGSWGYGIFQNDSALDLVSATLEPLQAKVRAFVEAPTEDGFDEALAAVAIINRVVGAEGDTVTVAFEREEAVRCWESLVGYYRRKVAKDPEADTFTDPRIAFVAGELSRLVRNSLSAEDLVPAKAKDPKAPKGPKAKGAKKG